MLKVIFKNIFIVISGLSYAGLSLGTDFDHNLEGKIGNFISIPKCERGMGNIPTEVPSFEIADFAVNQELWVNIMGYNPSSRQDRNFCPNHFRELNSIKYCANLAVDQISKDEAVLFVSKLNQKVSKTSKYIYSLPRFRDWNCVYQNTFSLIRFGAEWGRDEKMLPDSNDLDRIHSACFNPGKDIPELNFCRNEMKSPELRVRLLRYTANIL